MLPGSRLIAATLFSCAAFLGQLSCLYSQEPAEVSVTAIQDLPEAPTPQFEVANVEPLGQQTSA